MKLLTKKTDSTFAKTSAIHFMDSLDKSSSFGQQFHSNIIDYFENYSELSLRLHYKVT